MICDGHTDMSQTGSPGSQWFSHVLPPNRKRLKVAFFPSVMPLWENHCKQVNGMEVSDAECSEDHGQILGCFSGSLSILEQTTSCKITQEDNSKIIKGPYKSIEGPWNHTSWHGTRNQFTKWIECKQAKAEWINKRTSAWKPESILGERMTWWLRELVSLTSSMPESTKPAIEINWANATKRHQNCIGCMEQFTQHWECGPVEPLWIKMAETQDSSTTFPTLRKILFGRPLASFVITP